MANPSNWLISLARTHIERAIKAGVPDTIGLDYTSARECTPRWYGVSFGDGNNGVSHLFPAYYVRTADPWRLARIAILAAIKDEYKARIDDLDINGEEDYTVYAIIRNPPDEKTQCHHCGKVICCDDSGEWKDNVGSDICTASISGHEPTDEDWCSVNGAWMICEVFPLHPFQVDIYNGYTSMEEAFTADELKLGACNGSTE